MGYYINLTVHEVCFNNHNNYTFQFSYDYIAILNLHDEILCIYH